MKTLRVAICVMLIVGVLAMSLSVYAVDFSDTVNSYEYLWAYYIYQFLSSIGIDVTYRDIVGYTDEVQDTIIDWVINYIADLIEADSQPSNYSIAQWVAPWQAEYDYWGNLKFNSTMLEDMQDFAEWLKSKFGLIDNSTIVINPEFAIGAYNLYQFNRWYTADKFNGQPQYAYIEWDSTSGSAPEYFMCRQSNNIMQLVAISTHAFSGQYQFKYSNNTLEVSSTEFGSMNGENRLYGVNLTNFYVSVNYFSSYYPENANYFVGTNSQFTEFLNIANIETRGDVKVISGSIELPSDNPTYNPGDGMTIIDGVPEYSVINIDNVTVDNLPAIITQKTIPDVGNDEDNPGFSVPWQAINGLIQYVAAPAGAIMALVNEAPVEGVIMLYALIGGMIIFGMIRIMREH